MLLVSYITLANLTKLSQLSQGKFNKPTVLPLAEDVKALHCYLTAKSEECMASLTDGPTVDAWNLLCQVTLAQVVVFNRRRGGEAQRMLTAAYCSDTIENVNEDVTAVCHAWKWPCARNFALCM